MKTWRVTVASAAMAALPLRGHAAEGDLSSGAGVSLPFATPAADGTGFANVELEFGLSETFHAGLDLASSLALEDLGPRSVWLTPRLGAKFDAISWVPHISSGPSAVLVLEPEARFALGADVAVGLDYRLSRSFSFGAQYHFSFTADDGGQLLHRAGVRGMYHWGW